MKKRLKMREKYCKKVNKPYMNSLDIALFGVIGSEAYVLQLYISQYIIPTPCIELSASLMRGTPVHYNIPDTYMYQ